MNYIVPEGIDMKNGKVMAEHDLISYIKRKRIEERLSFPQISKALEKEGYVGVRNREPLKPHTVRWYWFNKILPNLSPQEKMRLHGQSGDGVEPKAQNDTHRLRMVRTIVHSGGDAVSLINVLKEILK